MHRRPKAVKKPRMKNPLLKTVIGFIIVVSTVIGFFGGTLISLIVNNRLGYRNLFLTSK